jgi:hypothetical protein
MSALSIEVPFPVFQDRDGQPLENGYVWLGVANLNPQTNPVIAYFDKALTIPAAQPLRTINGYISNAGTPAQVYVDGVSFSILVQDSKGSMVYNFPDGTGISPDACGVTYDPPFAGAVAYPVCEKLEQTISVKDFGAVGDGVADDTVAIQAALDYINGVDTKALYFPTGQYRITSNLSITGTLSFGAVLFGEGGFGESGSSIFVDFDGIGLTNQSASVQFKNLAFKGLRLGASVAVKNQKSSNTDDMDTAFYECTFESFNTCIQHVGRGLLVNNNTFGVSDLAIDISWPTSGTEGTDLQALPYGMRKWLITGNLFHSLGNAIAVTGANAEYFRAATITGNVMDAGRQFFTGPISFSTISGNSIQNANSTPIAISGACENVTISSNSIGGYEGTGTLVFKPAYGIIFASGTTVKNVTITGNDIHYTSVGGIRSEANFENVIISSNAINNYNLNAGTSFAIFVTGDLLRCSINANSFGTNPGNTRVIRVQGTVTHCDITGNSWDVSQGGLANVDTLSGSIVQGTAVSRVLTSFGAENIVNGELQIYSSKNDSAWDTVIDNFGEFAVYSSDSSGGGSGKRAAIKAKPVTATGSTTYWQFTTADGTTNDVPTLNLFSSNLTPVTDGTYNLGSASNKYGTLFAATGTINTSDGNEKQQIRELSETETKVAVKLKSAIRAFKFNDAVEVKGNAARIHIGVIAQDVATAFESEGLNPNNYGMFCSDEMPDGTVRFGVRYDELLAFIIGAM